MNKSKIVRIVLSIALLFLMSVVLYCVANKIINTEKLKVSNVTNGPASDNLIFNNSLISSYYYYVGEHLDKFDHRFTVMATPESAEFVPDIVKKLDELTHDKTTISETYVFKSSAYRPDKEANQFDGDVCILFSKLPKLIGTCTSPSQSGQGSVKSLNCGPHTRLLISSTILRRSVSPRFCT